MRKSPMLIAVLFIGIVIQWLIIGFFIEDTHRRQQQSRERETEKKYGQSRYVK